jgi:hypothetical protein
MTNPCTSHSDSHTTTAARDRWVPGLLLLGGFVAGIGWIAGVVLLWASDTWSTREKVMGTLLFPFGLALAAFTLGMTLTYGHEWELH